MGAAYGISFDCRHQGSSLNPAIRSTMMATPATTSAARQPEHHPDDPIRGAQPGAVQCHRDEPGNDRAGNRTASNSTGGTPRAATAHWARVRRGAARASRRSGWQPTAPRSIPPATWPRGTGRATGRSAPIWQRWRSALMSSGAGMLHFTCPATATRPVRTGRRPPDAGRHRRSLLARPAGPTRTRYIVLPLRVVGLTTPQSRALELRHQAIRVVLLAEGAHLYHPCPARRRRRCRGFRGRRRRDGDGGHARQSLPVAATRPPARAAGLAGSAAFSTVSAGAAAVAAGTAGVPAAVVAGICAGAIGAASAAGGRAAGGRSSRKVCVRSSSRRCPGTSTSTMLSEPPSSTIGPRMTSARIRTRRRPSVPAVFAP